jgi:ubiquinone/menaquinone biosynthesis C-methylase UbiE
MTSDVNKRISVTSDEQEQPGPVATRSSPEFDRVRTQARAWEAATGRLLDQVELAPGARCLDCACGPGETMRLMAQRVGPAGEVIGIDVDAEFGLRAVEMLHGAGHRQCSVAVVDLTADDEIPGAPFDLVYARLLLTRLIDPVDVIRRLWEAVANGGHLVIQDYDTRTIDVVPPLEAIAELQRLLRTTVRAGDGRLRLGHQLPLMLAEAGIGAPDGTDVAGLLTPLAQLGPQLTDIYRGVLPVAVSLGISTQARADRWLSQLDRDIAEHPNHAALWPLLIGVWKGKTPAVNRD